VQAFGPLQLYSDCFAKKPARPHLFHQMLPYLLEKDVLMHELSRYEMAGLKIIVGRYFESVDR